MNKKVPFSVGDSTDYPISLYAASKINELMAYSYHLYDLPVTGLRFLQFMVLTEGQIWHIINSQRILFLSP